MTYAIRGAITADADTREAIDEAVGQMMKALFEENGLREENLVSVIFSQTRDLRSRNAAAACRASGFCSRAIRVLVTAEGGRKEDARMVYLKGASVLRPDLRR